MVISARVPRTSGDILFSKDQLLGHSSSHADI